MHGTGVMNNIYLTFPDILLLSGFFTTTTVFIKNIISHVLL
jgi:hypothetical protein